MPKKKYHNTHQRIKLNNIIKNLPINGHLNESQNALINFSNTWNEWVSENLPTEIQKLVAMNSFKNGTLSIRCINAVAASQLKHLQARLISAFNDAGHSQIDNLKFEIEKKQTTPKLEDNFTTGAKSQHIKEEPRESLSNEALDLLGHCEKGVKNEKLSASLKRLHNTLNNLKKT